MRLSAFDPATNQWTDVDPPQGISWILKGVNSIGGTLFVETYDGKLLAKSSSAEWILLRQATEGAETPGSIVGGRKINYALVLATNNAFFSSDGGAHWDRQILPPEPSSTAGSSNSLEQVVILENVSTFDVFARRGNRLLSRSFQSDNGILRGVSDWHFVDVGTSADHRVHELSSGVEGGELWALDLDRLWHSKDFGHTWEDRGPFARQYVYVPSMIADQQTSDVVYVGLRYGLLITRDGGRSWQCHAFAASGCDEWQPPDQR